MKTRTKLLITSALILCLSLVFASALKIPGNQMEKDGVPSAVPSIKDKPQSVFKLEEAKLENTDTAAWIHIPNTTIDSPVMQSTDNEYYLRRNEKKENDPSGCFFADYYATLSNPKLLRQNTVIYGHSTGDEDPTGKHFNQLFNFKDIEFLKNNPLIYLTVDDEELIFQIFAVFYTNVNFYYIDPEPFSTDFESFMDAIHRKNEYNFEEINITKQDHILTLSTCSRRFNSSSDGRFVVMAKLVETKPTTPITIIQNPDPERQ
ncbi:class B sortase [Clostridium cadaveris]|uniref:class B sortase n=1 Tax=Clostridium cadaveris TaxID=1529 RepID=UPI0015B491C1|nr:class B sortase [Clostridium cadaveris]NWK10807.1 class B sortase [Clostridium cadaveris]